MVYGTSTTSVVCAVCLLMAIRGLPIDGMDTISPFGMCDSEDNFCESEDKNKYLLNINVSGEEFNEGNKGKTRTSSKSDSNPTSMKETLISEVNNDSLSGIHDGQTQGTDNATGDWLGLQIPLVDGVRVRSMFFSPSPLRVLSLV